MSTQELRQGDCLEVLADLSGVEAIVGDPPANVAFMCRSWDRAHPVKDYALPCVPRSKAHERELRSEEAFVRYWAERYAMSYDIAAPNDVAILWTLPRTSFQTAAALRRAGWQGLSDAAKADYLSGQPLAMPAGVDERQLALFG